MIDTGFLNVSASGSREFARAYASSFVGVARHAVTFEVLWPLSR